MSIKFVIEFEKIWPSSTVYILHLIYLIYTLYIFYTYLICHYLIYNSTPLRLQIGRIPWRLLWHYSKAFNIDIQRARTRASHIRPARYWHWRSKGKHRVPQVHIQIGTGIALYISLIYYNLIEYLYSTTDSMVLACIAQFWSSGSCQVSAIRYRHIEGATAGLWLAGGHEWHTKVPNSSRRSFHRSFALRTYLVSVERLEYSGFLV